MNYKFNNIDYILKENKNDAFDYNSLVEYVTPYFNDICFNA